MTGNRPSRRPSFSLDNATAPVNAPESAVERRPVATPTEVPPRPRTPRNADAGPVAGAYPEALAGAVRLPGADMPAPERAQWRHLLRATAGKLARSYEDAAAAEDAWNHLVAQARTLGVPASLVVAAMADAGLPT